MVHFVAIPLGDDGISGDVQPFLLISEPKGNNVPAETFIGTGWDAFSIGQGEIDGSMGVPGKPKALFMYQPVMPAAQQDQIIH